MPATYEPIATTTLGSAAASITFSSIAGTYTDLRLVLAPISTGASSYNADLNFNSDTGSNYSVTNVIGDGSTASSTQFSNQTKIRFTYNGITPSAKPSFYTFDIFSYAGSTNKTCLNTASEDQNGTGWVMRQVGLWRNTSAITSITLAIISTTFAAGTTATLYGIKNA